MTRRLQGGNRNPYIDKFSKANSTKEIQKKYKKLKTGSLLSKIAITAGTVALGVLAGIAGVAIMVGSLGTAAAPGLLLLGAGVVTIIGALSGGSLATVTSGKNIKKARDVALRKLKIPQRSEPETIESSASDRLLPGSSVPGGSVPRSTSQIEAKGSKQKAISKNTARKKEKVENRVASIGRKKVRSAERGEDNAFLQGLDGRKTSRPPSKKTKGRKAVENTLLEIIEEGKVHKTKQDRINDAVTEAFEDYYDMPITNQDLKQDETNMAFTAAEKAYDATKGTAEQKLDAAYNAAEEVFEQ